MLTVSLREHLETIKEIELSGRDAAAFGAWMATSSERLEPNSFLWPERQLCIHTHMEHYFMPDNTCAMDSRGLDELDDVVMNAEYKPSAYCRDGNVLPPFYMSEVFEYQYTRVSKNHGFLWSISTENRQ